MSLTSYRAAPPRAILYFVESTNLVFCVTTRLLSFCYEEKLSTCILQTWQRPTLPRLETKYHQRWSVSRPSSGWDRVQPLRHNHQVGKRHVFSRSWNCHPTMGMSNANNQANRAISTGKLHTLLRFHTRPINVVVYHDSQGILVLRLVSRLDAFSGYLVRI